jgi:hypothetical protein
MSIYGILRISDTTKKVNEVGERTILDATNQYLEQHNRAWEAAERIFVEEVTEKYKFRYEPLGGGFMQRRGGLSRPGAVKPGDGWNVEIPLEGFGDDIGVAKDEFAYMDGRSFQRVIDNIRNRSMNTRRYEMLKALWNSTARAFKDKWAGDLTVQPLANNDSVIYPPVVGATSGAQAQHYFTSGFAASAISDANDPFALGRNKLRAFNLGAMQLVAFINSAQKAKTEALTDFVPVADAGVRAGANRDEAAYPSDLPALPGVLLGRLPGVWVAEWDAGVPANYILMRDMDAAAPLYRRRHPAATGIGDGVRLVAKSDVHPLVLSSYEDDFGYGVTNRIGAVAIELTADATYDIPADYI